MNVHEYQAKAILKEFGVPVSRGVPIMSAPTPARRPRSSAAPCGS